MAGIFLAGAAAGAAGGVAWIKHTQSQISAQEFVDKQLKRRVDQLALSEEQVQRIKPVLKKHEEVIRTLRRESFEDITAVFRDMNSCVESALSPEQREKFRAIQIEERERYEEQMRARARRNGAENASPQPEAKKPDGKELLKEKSGN